MCVCVRQAAPERESVGRSLVFYVMMDGNGGCACAWQKRDVACRWHQGRDGSQENAYVEHTQLEYEEHSIDIIFVYDYTKCKMQLLARITYTNMRARKRRPVPRKERGRLRLRLGCRPGHSMRHTTQGIFLFEKEWMSFNS